MKLHLLTHRKYAQSSHNKEKDDSKSEMALSQRSSLRLQRRKQNTDNHKDTKGQKITVKMFRRIALQKCTKCEKEFISKETLTKHMNRFHSGVEKQKAVKESEKIKKIGRPKYSLRSIQTPDDCSSEAETEIKSSESEVQSSSKISSVKPKEKPPPNNKISDGTKAEKKYECSQCQAKFVFKSNYMKHEATHREEKTSDVPKPEKKYKCSQCPAKFAFKSNFVKHEATHSTPATRSPTVKSSGSKPEKKFKCSVCPAQFVFKSNFLRHEVVHNPDAVYTPPEKKYNCSVCTAKFAFKSNLIRHEASHNQALTSNKPKQEKKFKCSECPAKFAFKSNLRKHEKTHNPDSKPSTDKREKKFKCTKCPAKFVFKSNFIKHKATHIQAGIPDKKFKCLLCPAKFSINTNLWKHRINYHPETDHAELPKSETSSGLEQDAKISRKNKPFRCSHCTAMFSFESNLRKHVKNYHNSEKIQNFKDSIKSKMKNTKNDSKPQKIITKKSVRCPLCQNTYNKKTVLIQHFREVHNISLQDEYITFSSEIEFKKWKARTEEEARCNYRIRHSVLYPDCKKVIYRCSRSGCYSSKTGVERQRKLKKVGSKKINGSCPAEMNVKVMKKTGTVFVHYQSTHVGHANELKYLDLNDEEREIIIRNITAGVTVNTLLQKFCIENNSNPQEARKRLHLLNKNEIRNVAKCAGLFNPTSRVRFKDDPITAQEWVDANSQSVLYCKWKGEFDERFPYLGVDDFLLIIMTNSQYEKLCRYGNNILYFDGNHGVIDSDFQLSILLVLNEMEKQYPCMFMFSNKTDEHTYNALIECLKEKVSSLQPEIIMTDMTESFYDMWAQMMPEPKFRLYCTWHVLRDWKMNLMKIHTLELRKQVSKTLEVLLHTTDDNHFMEELKEFMEHTFDCDDFQRYFMEEYLVKRPPKHWAHCYRQNISVNVNLSLKIFHKNVKYHVYGGNRVKTLDEALRRLDKYLIEKEHEDILLQEGCIPATNKIRVIRKRHSQMESVRVENIECVEEDEVWFITSCAPAKKSKNDDTLEDDVLTVYSVERTYTDCKTNDCMLKCEDCNACLHNFKCSCDDYTERGNMCIHIHILCLYLKVNSPESNGIMSGEEISAEETEGTLTEEESAEIDSEEEQHDTKPEGLADFDSDDDYSFTLSVTEISPVCSPRSEEMTELSPSTNQIKSEANQIKSEPMEVDHSSALEESVDDVEAKFAEIFKEIRQNPDEKLKYLNMLRQTAVALNELNST